MPDHTTITDARPWMALGVLVALLGFCFVREAPERANGLDRRAGKWGLFQALEQAELDDVFLGRALRLV